MALADLVTLPNTHDRARYDVQREVLVGSRCSSCGTTSWPSRAICHRCGLPAMVETDFPRDGVLLTYTSVWVARPGLEVPYTLGQVRLVDGPVVFAHIRGLREEITLPLPVRVSVVGGSSVPPFWFEPEERS
jgi:uncharacterized protein